MHISQLEGVYFYQDVYKKPIILECVGDNRVICRSDWWNEQSGVYYPNKKLIVFDHFGEAKFASNKITFSPNNFWTKEDKRNSVLFIGANTMNEIENYINQYHSGLFIEAIPRVYEQMCINLQKCNEKYHTRYRGINALTTNENARPYTFHIFNNNSQSSSIYQSNSEHWKWQDVKKVDEIELDSIRVKTVLEREKFIHPFHLILDVQGAELEVLKSFDDHLSLAKQITVEVSQKEYYIGGVLFDELDAFLNHNQFERQSQFIPEHGDVTYTNKSFREIDNKVV